jgi:hypothetical protein
MHDVVYQAFQINTCYTTQTNEEIRINDTAVFYRIGLDETEIPIVVTRIGPGSAEKKLVIAGPHGDERNAQRLIMAAQKRFIDEGPPSADTALYFIPCLSPTMCFADARGIPNEFWVNGSDGVPMTNGPFVLKSGLIIPALHEKMKHERRSKLQDQDDQINPDVGVDANRDYHLSLPSSKAFAEFMQGLTGIILRSGIKLSDRSGQNVTVFMMHGYDSSKSNPYNRNRGCVYGQYKLDNENPGIGVIPPIILQYIDMMTQSLFGYINAASGDAAADVTANREYFYQADNEVGKFNGEWIRHLYGDRGKRGILSFDIELGEAYREGERGDPSPGRCYNPNTVVSNNLPFFDLNRPGFFVPSALWEPRYDPDSGLYSTISFYSFLTSFYDRKKAVDDAAAKAEAAKKIQQTEAENE